MKILSWNINGIRAIERKGHIPDIYTLDMDLIFLQEIKAQSHQLSSELISPPGYRAIYHSAQKPGYSGVALWIHDRIAHQVISLDHHLPNNPVEDEGRVIHLTLDQGVNKLHIYGIYFPNGGKSEEAWGHKIAFYECLSQAIRSHLSSGDDVIWGGDINCAHTEKDLARAKENDGKIGFHPRERAWLDTMIDDGCIDIWRANNPHVSDQYSWWDQVTRSRDRNVGWRIDAWWANQGFVSVHNPAVTYLTDMKGSDHCPLMMEW